MVQWKEAPTWRYAPADEVGPLSSYLEVWGPGGRELHPLDSERVTVGTVDSNDLVVDVPGVSRVHAVFELFGDAWCVRDLGSRNGTFVNGGRTIGNAPCTRATRSCSGPSASSTTGLHEGRRPRPLPSLPP